MTRQEKSLRALKTWLVLWALVALAGVAIGAHFWEFLPGAERNPLHVVEHEEGGGE